MGVGVGGEGQSSATSVRIYIVCEVRRICVHWLRAHDDGVFEVFPFWGQGSGGQWGEEDIEAQEYYNVYKLEDGDDEVLCDP